MVIIRFNDAQREREALGFLIGRFSFKSWDDGRTMVPEAALGALAMEGITFIVEGPAKYEHLVPAVRDTPTAAI